jgi:hypothetical protein
MSFIKKINKHLKKVEASDRMDTFLDAATHSVAQAWEAASGRKMANESLYELNDTLTQFFTGVKYDWFRTSEGDGE